MSLSDMPKLPKQLAVDTGIRLGHVSRSLRELRLRGLVECLTPEARARGRVYGATTSGSTLIAFLHKSSSRFVPIAKQPVRFVPRVRATIVLQCTEFLQRAKGEAAARAALRAWSVDSDALTENDWLPVDVYDEFLELVEAAFGDGSYEFIRKMCAHAVPRVSVVKEQIMRLIPLEALAERATIAYNAEWNYGRLVVKTGKRWAAFSHYDWAPTPPMCSVIQGAYEGVLEARRVKGTVTKTRCVRSGDDHCEYLVQW